MLKWVKRIAVFYGCLFAMMFAFGMLGVIMKG